MISKKDEKTIRKMLSLATDQDEALTYDEMNGFLFGVAITPELVVPSEWLPLIFGEEMITVGSEEEANRLLNSLMRVYNDFVARFQNATLRFPFEKNYLAELKDLQVVQGWVYGLFEALSLRHECWFEMMPERALGDDEDEYVEEMMNSMGVIHGIADPEVAEEIFAIQSEETGDDRKLRLQASLFTLLPIAVETILHHAGMLEKERQQMMANRPIGQPTIRREEPKIRPQRSVSLRQRQKI